MTRTGENIAATATRHCAVAGCPKCIARKRWNRRKKWQSRKSSIRRSAGKK